MSTTYTEESNVKIVRDINSHEPILETWHNKAGKIHRDKGPAWIKYNPRNSEWLEIRYYKDGILGDEFQPSILKFDPNNRNIISETWYLNDQKHHSEDKPAQVLRDPNTKSISEVEYYKHGRLHRDNGPAREVYHDDFETGERKVILVSYYREGELHREDGPAIIRIDPKTDEIIQKEFYLNGERRNRIASPPPQPD